MNEPSKESFDQLEREHQQFRDAVFKVHGNWAMLENNLAWLLRAMLGESEGGPTNRAYAIYFAPNNTETRISIVAAAFEHSPIEGVSGPMLDACFRKVLAKINQAKDSRNKIAHGNLITVGTSGGSYMRFTGPFWDVKRGPMASAGTGQLPGMGFDEINQIAEKIGRCNSLVLSLSDLWDGQRKGESVAALQEKFLQLAAHLKTITPQQDAQTHPEPSGQRPSSQA